MLSATAGIDTGCVAHANPFSQNLFLSEQQKTTPADTKIFVLQTGFKSVLFCSDPHGVEKLLPPSKECAHQSTSVSHTHRHCLGVSGTHTPAMRMADCKNLKLVTVDGEGGHQFANSCKRAVYNYMPAAGVLDRAAAAQVTCWALGSRTTAESLPLRSRAAKRLCRRNPKKSRQQT